MNSTLYAPIYNKFIMMVKCQFLDDNGDASGAHYTYKCGIDVSVGQDVVARARKTYKVVRITEINCPIPLDNDITYRWIVSAINFEGCQKLLDYEKRLTKRIDTLRVDKLREQMIASIGVSERDLMAVSSEPITDEDTKHAKEYVRESMRTEGYDEDDFM